MGIPVPPASHKTAALPWLRLLLSWHRCTSKAQWPQVDLHALTFRKRAARPRACLHVSTDGWSQLLHVFDSSPLTETCLCQLPCHCCSPRHGMLPTRPKHNHNTNPNDYYSHRISGTTHSPNTRSHLLTSTAHWNTLVTALLTHLHQFITPPARCSSRSEKQQPPHPKQSRCKSVSKACREHCREHQGQRPGKNKNCTSADRSSAGLPPLHRVNEHVSSPSPAARQFSPMPSRSKRKMAPTLRMPLKRSRSWFQKESQGVGFRVDL